MPAACAICDGCATRLDGRRDRRPQQRTPKPRRSFCEEKQRKLVRRTDVDALIDQIVGIVVTHLSGMAARCSNDLVVRRKIDAVVYQIRKEIANACLDEADKRSEPPRDAYRPHV